MNPLLAFPNTPAGRTVHRIGDTGLGRLAPAGQWTPVQIPNPIFFLDAQCPKTFIQPTAIPQTQRLHSWTSRLGPANVFSESGGAPYGRKDRIWKNTDVWHSDSSTQFTQNFATGLCKTFPLTGFVVIKRHKIWSATATDPAQAGAFFFDMIGTSTNSFHLQYNSPNYTLDFIDGYSAGQFRSSTAPCVLSWSYDIIGFVIDATGIITFYENNLAIPGPTTKIVSSSNLTSVKLGRASGGIQGVFIAAVGLFQYAVRADEWKQLGRYLRASLNIPGLPVDGPTSSLTVAGDSITAGESYVNSTNVIYPTPCERIAAAFPWVRVGDMTRSSTFIADGVTWMLSDGTSGQAGGNSIHSSYCTKKTHLICHGRNDLARGDSVATVLASLQTAVAQAVAFGIQNVGVATVIATINGTPTGTYPDQNTFDAAVVSLNAGILANYGSWGATFVSDVGNISQFQAGVGLTPYANTTYYFTDNTHPNGQLGEELLNSVHRAALAPYL